MCSQTSIPTIGLSPVVASSGSWLGHVAISSKPDPELYPSHPHPLPCTATVPAVILDLKASKLPKLLSNAVARFPAGSADSDDGHRFFQKSEWLRCPPRLNLTAGAREMSAEPSPVERASSTFPRRPFVLLT